MFVKSLQHMALHVTEVEKSVRFYQQALQLEALPRPAFDFPGAWFRLGTNQELHLIGNRQQPVYSHSRGTHFALEVHDLEKLEAHLQTLNIPYRPKKQRTDGAWQIFLTDPDGHWIECCQLPG
jgi:lactoylglutathione lyase